MSVTLDQSRDLEIGKQSDRSLFDQLHIKDQPDIKLHEKLYIALLLRRYKFQNENGQVVIQNKQEFNQLGREVGDKKSLIDFIALLQSIGQRNSGTSELMGMSLRTLRQQLAIHDPISIGAASVSGEFIGRVLSGDGNCLEYVSTTALISSLFFRELHIENALVVVRDSKGNPHFAQIWRTDEDRRNHGIHFTTFEGNTISTSLSDLESKGEQQDDKFCREAAKTAKLMRW